MTCNKHLTNTRLRRLNMSTSLGNLFPPEAHILYLFKERLRSKIRGKVVEWMPTPIETRPQDIDLNDPIDVLIFVEKIKFITDIVDSLSQDFNLSDKKYFELSNEEIIDEYLNLAENQIKLERILAYYRQVSVIYQAIGEELESILGERHYPFLPRLVKNFIDIYLPTIINYVITNSTLRNDFVNNVLLLVFSCKPYKDIVSIIEEYSITLGNQVVTSRCLGDLGSMLNESFEADTGVPRTITEWNWRPENPEDKPKEGKE